jgi:hypothetical protein
MEDYDFSMALACSSFRVLWGIPLYGIVRIGVEALIRGQTQVKLAGLEAWQSG